MGLNQDGGFETGFFFPRVAILTPPFPRLPPQNILNISNNNYYPITVTQLTVEVLHLSLVVGQVSDSLLLHIGPLASEQVTSSPWPALPTGVWMRVVVGRWQLELVAHLTPIWLTGILCSSQQDTGRKHIVSSP